MEASLYRKVYLSITFWKKVRMLSYKSFNVYLPFAAPWNLLPRAATPIPHQLRPGSLLYLHSQYRNMYRRSHPICLWIGPRKVAFV